MDEDTTTAQDVQATGADEALPVEQNATDTADAQAVAEPSESSEGAESSEPSADEKLQKYAASQGLELDSPGAIKAAQLAMKNQSEATRNYQKASELERTATAISDTSAEEVAEATGQDPDLIKRLQRVEVKESVRDFWNTPGQDGNVPDRGFESKMVELLGTKPYLAGDLESLYASAVFQSGGVAAVKSQGKREALESLAHRQQAAVPTGNATTGAAPKGKPFDQLSIPEMEKRLGFVRR